MTEQTTGQNNIARHLKLATGLRRHYGPKWGAEPTIVIRPDGTVLVSAEPNHTAELTAEEAEMISNAE